MGQDENTKKVLSELELLLAATPKSSSVFMGDSTQKEVKKKVEREPLQPSKSSKRITLNELEYCTPHPKRRIDNEDSENSIKLDESLELAIRESDSDDECKDSQIVVYNTHVPSPATLDCNTVSQLASSSEQLGIPSDGNASTSELTH